MEAKQRPNSWTSIHRCDHRGSKSMGTKQIWCARKMVVPQQLARHTRQVKKNCFLRTIHVHHTFENLIRLDAFATCTTRGPLGFVTMSENHEAVSLFCNDDLVCPSFCQSLNRSMASMRRVALTKTYLPGEIAAFAKSMAKVTSVEAQKKGQIGGGIDAVVRTARNPGDNVLRNAFRWNLTIMNASPRRLTPSVLL